MAQSGPRGANPLKAPLAFGLVILFQQIVDFGKVFAIRQEFSPSFILWPVFITMCLASLYAFLKLDHTAMVKARGGRGAAPQSAWALGKAGR
jgi:lipopolysaccharide export LptBFGC system permease protein LptF